MPTNKQIEDHKTSVATAKAALQATLVGNPSEATKKTAHITYQKAILASARTNGHSTGAFEALHSLGADVSGQAGDT